MTIVHDEQARWVRGMRLGFAMHVIRRIQQRVLPESDDVPLMHFGDVRRLACRAWNRSHQLEVFTDPDRPELPTYVAQVYVTEGRPDWWYLVGRPTVMQDGAVGMMLISALEEWQYVNNRHQRWGPWPGGEASAASRVGGGCAPVAEPVRL